MPLPPELRSPFPGMDPFLEQYWRDVHHRFITYACDDLQAVLPGALRARVEERVLVETPGEGGRGIYPDVRVVEDRQAPRSPRFVGPHAAGVAEIAVAEPLLLDLAEPVSEGYIEVVDVSTGNRVVTVLELVSTANKEPGQGRRQYLRKQHELLAGDVALVEIDLLRAGRWVVSVPRTAVPPARRTPYCACVRRPSRAGSVEFYPVSLRERLPVIRVPLRDDDADVTLDLQSLLDRCYRLGRYDAVDYRGDPEPPLGAEDAAWADALLRAGGWR